MPSKGWQAGVLYVVRKTGRLSDAQAIAGVYRSTVWRAARRDPEFAAELEAAKREAEQRREDGIKSLADSLIIL